MNYFLLVIGIVIVLSAISDLLYTAFSPDRAGIFANAITKNVYALFREVSTRLNSPKLFELAGVVIIVLILMFWYVAVWVGSSLVFCSVPDSVVNSSTGVPASLAEKFYYTGFTITTLGVGDFNAGSTTWRILTVILSFTGFVLLTTAISYMIPVLSATVVKRKLGSYIAMLGETPQDILKNQWQGDGYGKLESHFNSITEVILQHAQQLLAYPVIYCFYSSNPRKSVALNIAKLDEALTILLLHVSPKYRPSEQSIYPLRKAILDYLIIHRNYFIELRSADLTYPETEGLKEVGIPVLYGYEDLKDAYKELDDRRKLTASILKEQGRDFSDIYKERNEYKLQL